MGRVRENPMDDGTDLVGGPALPMTVQDYRAHCLTLAAQYWAQGRGHRPEDVVATAEMYANFVLQGGSIPDPLRPYEINQAPKSP